MHTYVALCSFLLIASHIVSNTTLGSKDMVLILISVVYLVCDFGKVKLDVCYFEIFYDQKKKKNPPAMQGTQATCVRSLGQEYPLEKEMTTHCSVPAWKIPWAGDPSGLQSMGSHRESDTTERPSTHDHST